MEYLELLVIKKRSWVLVHHFLHLHFLEREINHFIFFLITPNPKSFLVKFYNTACDHLPSVEIIKLVAFEYLIIADKDMLLVFIIKFRSFLIGNKHIANTFKIFWMGNTWLSSAPCFSKSWVFYTLCITTFW